MDKMNWKKLALAAAFVALSSGCQTTAIQPRLPLPPPVSLPAESDNAVEMLYDCVSDPAFEYVIRLRERNRTLDDIIRTTHQ